MVGSLSVIIRLLRCSLSLALLSFSIIIIITHGCMPAPLSFLIFVSSSPNTLPPSRKSTPKTHKQIQQKHYHHHQQHHQFHIFPPHPPLQSTTPHPKIPRTPTQPIRLIHQQINPLPSLQHPFNILCHNTPHILNLALHIPKRILLSTLRRAIFHHEFLQLAVERCCAIGR